MLFLPLGWSTFKKSAAFLGMHWGNTAHGRVTATGEGNGLRFQIKRRRAMGEWSERSRVLVQAFDRERTEPAQPGHMNELDRAIALGQGIPLLLGPDAELTEHGACGHLE